MPVKQTPKAAAKKAAKPKAPVKPGRKSNAGRPTSYRDEYAKMAYKFCLLGANDEKLASLFEVAVSTIYEWKKAVPEFSEAVMRGKEVADAEVAHSLYHRALGYKHQEDDIRVVNGAIVITPTIKHYPPDTAAATLWLKNRQPQTWRDKVENVVTGADGGPINHSMTVTFVKAK